MTVKISPRGNGACPLCSRLEGCRIRESLRETLGGLPPAKGQPLELVVYYCPQFKEKP